MRLETERLERATDVASEKTALQVVGFQLGGEEYAIDVLEIVGVERLENVLKLPRMPTFIEGVMRIRDEVVPLVKLRRRFGLDDKDNDDASRVVVVEQGDCTVGLVVDAVSAVRRFDVTDIEEAPGMALTIENRFVNGVIRVADRMIILLKPDAILREDESELVRRTAVVASHYALGEDDPEA